MSAKKSVINRAREIFNKGISEISETDKKLVHRIRPWDLRILSKHNLYNEFSYLIDSSKEVFNNSISEKYIEEGMTIWLNNMGFYSYAKFYNIDRFEILKTDQYLDREGNIVDNPYSVEKEIILKKDSNTFEPINVNGTDENSKLNITETLNFTLELFNRIKKKLGHPNDKFKIIYQLIYIMSDINYHAKYLKYKKIFRSCQ